MNARNMFYSSDFNFSDAEERAYAREDLVFNVTEDLLVKLEELELSKAELARRLGKSKSYVSQVLSGSRNMTLGSFSDICFALGFKPEINIPVKPVEPTKVEWTKSFKFELAKPKARTAVNKTIYLAHDESWENCKVA